MKKIAIFIITVLVLVLSSGCDQKQVNSQNTEKSEIKQNDEKQNKTTEDDKAQDSGGAIKVDEGLLSVEVTLPANFFTDMSEDDIKSVVKENGYKKYVINEDGSVTYTMTKSKLREMKESFKQGIDETIEDYINGEDAVESFEKIEYTDDLSRVDIYVNKEKYTPFDCFSALSFYIMGAYYQMFDGVPADEVNIIVNFIDIENDEILDSSSYKDFIANVSNE